MPHSAGGHGAVSAHYHDYKALTAELQQLARSKCRRIFRYFSIGQSVQGRELWVVRITDNPDEEEDEPEFFYGANIHGDETLGRELLIGLARDICARHAAGDAYVRWLVRSTDVYLAPSLNPDGFEAGTRANAAGWDLNRNFPDQVTGQKQLPQPEMQALQRFLGKRRFSLGANLHAGTLVCNYPWDDRSDGAPGRQPSISPDDALYRQLCAVYSRAHPRMHLSMEFSGGITNGAAYFAIYGGLQDYAYGQHGQLHTTLELGHRKRPLKEQLPAEWHANRAALYAYLEQVHSGVHGVVRCTCDRGANATLRFSMLKAAGQLRGPLPLAQVIETQVDPSGGDYHRVLLPGSYLVKVEGCSGALIAAQRVEVPELTKGARPRAVRADFELQGLHCPLGPLWGQGRPGDWPAPFSSGFLAAPLALLAAPLALLALGAWRWRRHAPASCREGSVLLETDASLSELTEA